MSNAFYGRLFELYVSDLTRPFIESTSGKQFKIQFRVLIDFGAFNSYAEISVFNLSRETEGQVFERGQPIALRAGYENAIDNIFKGEITNVQRLRQGTSMITRAFCKSGAVQTSSSSINKTLGQGALITAMIRECAAAIGYPVVMNDNDFSDVVGYSRGKVLFGDPKSMLHDLAYAHDFAWTIENETIVILRDGFDRGGFVNTFSQFTGMVGSPEITEVGADVTLKLTPKLQIGGRFKIDSVSPIANFSNVYFQEIPKTLGEGTYKIQRIDHSGDSYADTWETKVVGIR